MKSLSEKMIVFRYQMRHILSGKEHIEKNLKILRPELTRYIRIAEQLKEKSKDISTMETGLKRLEQQEQKNTAELDNAFKEYVELKEQAAGFYGKDYDRNSSRRYNGRRNPNTTNGNGDYSGSAFFVHSR